MSSNVRQLYSIVKFKKNIIFLTCRFRAILGYCGPLNNLGQRTTLFSFLACCIMFFVLFSLKPWCCVRVYSMTLYFILFFVWYKTFPRYISSPFLTWINLSFLCLTSTADYFRLIFAICTEYLKTSPDPVKSITPKTYIFCRYFMNAREI